MHLFQSHLSNLCFINQSPCPPLSSIKKPSFTKPGFMISDHHTMTATTDQWTMMQLYQQSTVDDEDNLLEMSAMLDGLISDANNSPVLTTTTSSSSPSPTSPKASVNNGSRPIRRRSRASRRTPTTLLNANTTNFRALVQQFTGCPSTTSMSFDVYKGPITLNFKQGSRQVHHHHHNKPRTTVTTASPASAAAPFGNTGFKSEGHHQYQYQQQQPLANQQQQWPLQDHHHHQQQQQQNVDDNTDLFSSSINSSSSKPNMEISDDGLIMDYNYSLHDLTVNNAGFFSNNDDMIQNGTYYM